MALSLSEMKKLYDKGFALIYLHPKQKRPIENKWTTGPRKSWKELEKQFNPNFNLGVRLGEVSKLENGYLCCIDVDIIQPQYRDVALDRLRKIKDGKLFCEVISGSGNNSSHLYGVSKKPFKMIEIEKHKDKWSICAYSNGRQMVLPPSIHPNGKEYQWLVNSKMSFPLFDVLRFQKAETPEKLVDDFQAVGVDLYASKLDMRSIKLITEGKGANDRSADLLSVAMKMCRVGFTDNQILSVLSDTNNWIGDTAYEHRNTNSRRAAVSWLKQYTLAKARYETHPLRLFENAPDYSHLKKTPEQKKETLDGIKEEISQVLPDLDGRLKPRPTLRNMVHILEHFMGGGIVGFNEFSCRPYFLKDTIYGGKKGQEVSDNDDLQLKHYIACHYRFEPSKELCFETHTLLSYKHKWHPIREYLNGLTWDGVKRLDTWLVQAFQARGPREYVAAIGRKVLVAAVTRVFEPGCKFDYMLVLEGKQGERKSMSLEALIGRQWFTDSLGDIHNKDVVDQMIGKWLIEVSELDSIRGREAESVKAFVSRQVDRVRLSYGRRSQDYPRQCIFVGSTNDEEYLTDATGNRRYWPVQVGTANTKWVTVNRDQLWAEAKFLYECEERLYLTKELESVAKHEQEKRFEVDEWEREIKAIVQKEENETFTTTELWRAINMHVGNAHPPMHESKRIGKIMRRLGFKRFVRRVDGQNTKCWAM